MRGIMEIVKHTTTTYEILKVIADKPIFVYGKFKKIRLERGMSISRWAKCFSCNHVFKDDEPVYFGCVRNKGNIFFCKDCSEKYNTETTS